MRKSRQLLLAGILHFLCLSVFAGQGSDIRTAAGISNGLCVTAGISDAAVLIELSNSGQMLVHGLVLDKNSCEQARASIATAGLYGVVSVEKRAALNQLPYKDNVVTLLVVDAEALGGGASSQVEMERVVAPGSVLYVKQSGTWRKTIKQRPASYENWGHWNKSADNNARSEDPGIAIPQGFQWMAGWDRQDTHSGRFRIWGNYAVNQFQKPDRKHYFLVRDAFTGIPLWEKTAANFTAPTVAYDGKLYAVEAFDKPLASYDLKTGQKLISFDAGGLYHNPGYNVNQTHMWAAVSGNHVAIANDKTLTVCDAGTGASIGQAYQTGYLCVYMPVIDSVGKRVFFGEGDSYAYTGRWYTGQSHKSVVCCDLTTGSVLWKKPIPTDHLSQIVFGQGKLVTFPSVAIAGSGGARDIVVVDPATGNTIWKKSYVEGGYNGIVLDNELAFFTSHAIYSYNLANGDSISWSHGNQGCMKGIAFPTGLMFGHLGFIDNVKNHNYTYTSFQRPSCATGAHPANGLWYAGSNPRCLCIMMYRTHMVWTCRNPDAPAADASRLEQGTSLTGPASTSPGVDGDKDAGTLIRQDWTIGLYGQTLSNSVVPTFRVVGGKCTTATFGGSDYYAYVHQHRLEALQGGVVKWTYTAGGRIPSPPVVYNGRVYFGCHDGYLYCLDQATGAPQWRFLAAAVDKRICVAGQVESVWPATNAVVHDGKIVVAAGWTAEADGGTYVWGLEPSSGAVAWKFRLYTPSPTGISNIPLTASGNKRDPGVLPNFLAADPTGGLLVRGVFGGRADIYYSKSLDPVAWNGKTVDISQNLVVAASIAPNAIRSASRPIISNNRILFPRAGKVRVAIIDTKGRTVKVVLKGTVAAGIYNLWDTPLAIASGKYVVRVEEIGASSVTAYYGLVTPTGKR